MQNDSKQLELYPERMGLQGAGGSLDMVDETGITLNSQSGFTMVANGKINIEAPNVNISVPLEIQMRQSSHYASAVASAVVPVGTGAARVGVMVAPTLPPAAMAAEASVMLCNQFDFVGGNGTRLYGCVYVQYNPFEDAPQEGEFSLLKSIGFAILAAVAVIACAAFLGVAGLALACVAVGACVVAGCIAYTDYQSGNNSGLDKYLFGAVTGGVIGGVSYVFAAAALAVAPGITTFLQGVGAFYSLPFVCANASTLATIGSIGFASFFGIQGANMAFSNGLGTQNALIDTMFGGTDYYDNALQVYNSFTMIGIAFGFTYIQTGAMHMPQTQTALSSNKEASGVGGSIREKLLGKVENPKLKNAINEIYRPGATTGDGGLADAVRHELSTGNLVGGKSHMQKALERVTNLENIISKQNLSSGDLEIASKLLDDLKNALGGK